MLTTSSPTAPLPLAPATHILIRRAFPFITTDSLTPAPRAFDDRFAAHLRVAPPPPLPSYVPSSGLAARVVLISIRCFSSTFTMDSSPPLCSRPPRAVLALDPFVSNAQAPLQFLSTRGSGTPQYTPRKGMRDTEMSPPRVASHKSWSANAAATGAGSIKGPAARTLQLPPTPTGTPQSLPTQSTTRPYDGSYALPTLDVEMTDSFATPPMSRTFPTTSTLQLPSSSSPAISSSGLHRSGLAGPPTHLAPINTSNLLFATAPLTPPLTPPFSSIHLANTLDHALSPSASSGQSGPPPSHPPTLSASILLGYSLHPLFDATYTIHEELGCGGFGFVVRASIDSTGESVAVKFIERSKIPADSWVLSRSFKPASGVEPSGPDGQRLLPLEAYVLGSIKQINGVVRYIDLYEDETYFYLVRSLPSRWIPSRLLIPVPYSQIMELHGSPWLSDKDSVPAPPMYAPQQTATPISSPMFSPLDLSPPRQIGRASCRERVS